MAFGSLGIHSQMIRPFPDDDDKGLQERVGNPWLKDRSRLLNAVSSALITGTGMSYGSPSEHYKTLLGFEPEFAEQIVVEYWVRHRVNKEPKADFIAVVRQFANGYIEIILPDPKTGLPQVPRSVYETSCYLQTQFAKGKKSDRIFTSIEDSDVPNSYVVTFFQSQLIGREQPTLIVPQVGDWRSRETAWFHDDGLEYNCVSIGNMKLVESDLENVRIVKMLSDEEHNMRYWLDNEPTDIDNPDSLIAVHDNLATVPTIYSIDSRLEDENEEPDVEKLEQRSRVVEFAALMMQPADNDAQTLAWCLIPHFSRIHPGWGKGATIHPYPYHVMCNLVEDALWAVFDKERN